jgi:hypothetical protein
MAGKPVISIIMHNQPSGALGLRIYYFLSS